MAFTDVIDDYTTGQTGTLTDDDGQSVAYTITDGATTFDQQHHGDDSAKITSDGSEALTITFDEPTVGISITFNGSDSDESYFVLVDGVQVDLNTLIESGDATFSNIGTDSTHSINEDGSVSGGVYNDGSIGQLTFNIPVTSVGAVGGNTGNTAGYDGIEVGIDSAAFDVVCFTRDTSLMTSDGPAPIQDLKVGDYIQTVDHGAKPILWIGQRRFNTHMLNKKPKLRPVRIERGALGQDLPKEDLLVSRQHRILITSNVAEKVFGVKEVLIPAIKLVGLPGIAVDQDVSNVEYIHILLDAHEIITAQGVPTESLYTGPEGLKAMSDEARKEVLAIFPECIWQNSEQGFARPVPNGAQQKLFIERLQKQTAV